MKIGLLSKSLLLTGLLSMTFAVANAQLAVKTNLLYGATTTPNIGAEVGVGKKSTMQLFYGINPWEFGSQESGVRQMKHWVLMPEYRWWTCSKFNGWFLGVHAMGGQFNAGNIDIPFPGAFFSGENLRQGMKDFRYQGWYAGGGVTVGYQWILGKHWNLEAEVGVGYDRVWYDKYPCAECGTLIESAATNYAGVTKLGLSILYIF